MNCIIVDDDEMIITSLSNFIEKTEGLKLIKAFTDPIEASIWLKENNEVELVFLDVEMPNMTGVEMLKHFELPQIILISFNKEYAADAYDYNVTDFLSKPVSYSRFLKAIEKVNTNKHSVSINNDNSSEIFIKDGTRYIKLNVEDIMHLEAMADYIRIYTIKEKYTIMSTMKMIEEKMSKFGFIRIHRSHIINPKHVKEIEENSVCVDGTFLTISRFYRQDFFKKLNLI